MSKIFDAIKSGQLLDNLKTVSNPGELDVIKVLMEEVKLIVKIGQVCGETITTNTGTPQGECIRTVLVTLYLARVLDDAETKPRVDGPRLFQALELLDHV